jgi:integrase
VILPSLNRCVVCHKSVDDHAEANHKYERDRRIPEWHGWHAGRRGLGSNPYRLGVPEKVIQAILRHANVSATATYYIKTAVDDVRNAMAKLESSIPSVEETPKAHWDTNRTLNPETAESLGSVN